jgi:D-serine deaminase-like pyridoxal phosphate-dependent protein
MQLEAGAIGFTCARIREVEVLVQHGFKSMLVANEVVGAGKLKRILELSRTADVILAVDDLAVVDELVGLAHETGVQPNVVVDVDLGLHRCGVAGPNQAASLARAIVERGLRLRGIMGYEGHLQLLPPGPEKDAAVNVACRDLIAAKEAVERLGYTVEIVSMAGTGSYTIAAKYPGITEVQCGTFLVMDTGYAPFAPEFTPALSILATVISRTPGDRMVLDTGVKVISGERGLPFLRGHNGVRVKALHAEHALLDLSQHCLSYRPGDKVEIWVHYSDGTLNLHDRMYGIRNGKVEQVILIERCLQ